MKKFKYTSQIIIVFASVLTVLTLGCERELSDDISLAKYPNTPEVFTDFPVSLTDQFFISFDPAEGANVNGFDVDNNAYKGTNAIRIDVPGSSDPEGGFIGGIFKDRFLGRDLTEYDALTFWAKGTTTASIGLFGFGTDFEEDKFNVGLEEINLTTTWKQYIIPFPDPARLVQEKGMFSFAAGTDSTDGLGYTFWIDEIRFQKLGYFTQSRPKIFDGLDKEVKLYNGSKINVDGTSQTFSLGNGSDVTVSAAAAYFNYTSSDTAVATVDEDGVVTVLDIGTTTITANLNGVDATGSLIVESLGEFTSAPVPVHEAENVISIFSDSYEDSVESNFEPGYGGSTTVATTLAIPNGYVLEYKSNNYTGIEFWETPIDASSKTHMHVDIFIFEGSSASSSVEFQIRDIGDNGIINTNIYNGFPTLDDKDKRYRATGLTPGEWVSIEIPLDGNLANQKDNLGSIVLVGGPNFYLDNIYFY